MGIYNYYERLFDNLNIALLIEQQGDVFDDVIDDKDVAIPMKDWRQVSKVLAREHPSIGIWHGYETRNKGGRRRPHVHLLLNVPETKQQRFLDGLDDALHGHGKVRCCGQIEMVPDTTPNQRHLKIKNWRSLLRHCLGVGRQHLPVEVWCKSNKNVQVPFGTHQRWLDSR